MRPLLMVYATREGHTHRITTHLADVLQRQGVFVECADVAALGPDFDLGARYAGVIVAGSVHAGRHEPELAVFTKRHRAALESIPNALSKEAIVWLEHQRASFIFARAPRRTDPPCGT